MMNHKQSNYEQLNGIIEYLHYEGPLFIRMNSDFEPDLQKGVSIAEVSDTI
jgi:hypothetical protein